MQKDPEYEYDGGLKKLRVTVAVENDKGDVFTLQVHEIHVADNVRLRSPMGTEVTLSELTVNVHDETEEDILARSIYKRFRQSGRKFIEIKIFGLLVGQGDSQETHTITVKENSRAEGPSEPSGGTEEPSAEDRNRAEGDVAEAES